MRWPWQEKRSPHLPREPREPKPKTFDEALEQALIKHAADDPDWAFGIATKRMEQRNEKDKPKDIETLKSTIIFETLQKDEGLREAVVENYKVQLGLVPGSDLPDPQEELERGLNAIALQEIEKDPVLKKQAVDSRIKDILGSRSKTQIEEFRESLNVLRDLRAEFGDEGQKDGGLASLWSPDATTEALKLLGNLLTGKGKTYLVEIEGQTREVTVEQYLQLKNQKQLAVGRTVSPQLQAAPLPEPTTPKQVPTQGVDTAQQDGTQQAFTPQVLANYMSQPPGVLANALQKASKEGGDSQATTLLDFLMENSTEEIVSALDTLGTDWAECVSKLQTSEGESWLEELQGILLGKHQDAE